MAPVLLAERVMRKLKLKIMDKEEKNVEVTYLSPYMKEVMEKLERDKKRPAVHTYNATLNSFITFLKNNGEPETVEIPVAEVFTPGKLKEYETWLRDKDAKWNTVSTYMRTLKAVRNKLIEEKLLEYNAKLFDDVYTKVESQTKRALTEEQMNTLYHADFARLPKDEQCALAYFLLMFLFRGMPFIDLAYLRKQDLKGDCITYCRHKTGRKIVVRIPKEAMPLFEQYRNKKKDSGYLFPILDGLIKNEKEMYAGYIKALHRFNRKLAKMGSLLLPGVEISSYTARHTWATLAFHSGIPVGIISKALGHSSVKVTETYLKPFENERVDEANDELIMTVVKSNKDDRMVWKPGLQGIYR